VTSDKWEQPNCSFFSIQCSFGIFPETGPAMNNGNWTREIEKYYARLRVFAASCEKRSTAVGREADPPCRTNAPVSLRTWLRPDKEVAFHPIKKPVLADRLETFLELKA
jgi:hypothetical protein